MTGRAVTDDTFGAWLVKCNPDNRPVPHGAVDDGLGDITRWCVTRGYRADMMQAGQRIVLWVSGNGKRMQRGIWGAGHVTGEVREDIPDDHLADQIAYWLHHDARRAVALFVPVDLPLWDEPLPAAEILAAGIDDLEVQRMPAGSNPSWVSADQVRGLSTLMEWRGRGENDAPAPVSDTGEGRGGPRERAVVDAAALAAVITSYGDGWKYEDVRAQKLGWDLTLTRTVTQEIARVTVRGTSGTTPTVLLTADECRAAAQVAGWRLATVTRALSDPRVVGHSAAEALAAAEHQDLRAFPSSPS